VPHSKHDYALGYEDSFCTVEGNSAEKIVRVYQDSTGNKEALLKRFNEAANTMMNIKHRNIAQIFGICQSLPAIIFHGSTWMPFNDFIYRPHLTAKEIILLHVHLFYDLQSVIQLFFKNLSPQERSHGYGYDGSVKGTVSQTIALLLIYTDNTEGC
jgi:hypothetical protein